MTDCVCYPDSFMLFWLLSTDVSIVAKVSAHMRLSSEVHLDGTLDIVDLQEKYKKNFKFQPSLVKSLCTPCSVECFPRQNR